jgi:hypothetical protein
VAGQRPESGRCPWGSTTSIVDADSHALDCATVIRHGRARAHRLPGASSSHRPAGRAGVTVWVEDAGPPRVVRFPAGYPAAVATGDADGDGVLDSVAEVDAALAAGSAIDGGIVKQFECPAIPPPSNRPTVPRARRSGLATPS